MLNRSKLDKNQKFQTGFTGHRANSFESFEIVEFTSEMATVW